MAILKFHITNPSNDTIPLSLKDSNFWYGMHVFNAEGLGPPKATVSGIGGPGGDGIRANSVRTDARHITLTLAISPGDKEETARQNIYTYFPIKQEITFRVETDDKDVYLTAIVESVEMNMFAKVENAVISLYCADPYYLDMQEIVLGSAFAIVVTTYTGEVPTGVVIDMLFDGTVNDGLAITNTAGSQSMHVDFRKMLSGLNSCRVGDQLIINTSVGQKSVQFWDDSASTWYDGIGGVSIDSDWTQMLLGGNVISIVPDTPAESSEISELEVKYRLRYEGV